MRFSRLSLERYGRFDDCELNFRPGSPDLHLIYGENEAGKTTSLVAVSDLLFGFPARSPYNFMFDYSLLRVGAILEDGDMRLACRRKKGTGSTLLGADDAAIDEAPLIAMLRGQNRDTFSLSFSLDQAALRQGGLAMIEARNDVGRTLFAAGSGLTGISDELRRLEGEADAIWGPTNRASRTFTQAQRQLAESAKTVREDALKPKSWLDAKLATDRARDALDAARRDRDAVQTESRFVERLRRIAPLVRHREEQSASLAGYDGVVDLGRQREMVAEALVQEAEEALRAIRAAESLRADKLSMLEQTLASHNLAKEQARARAQSARNNHEQVLADWRRRLGDAGLPELEPSRFSSWQADRDAAGAAQAELRDLVSEVERSEARRDAARLSLATELGTTDAPGPLGPVLARAETRRASLDEIARKRLLAQAEMDQVGVETTALDRRARAAEDAATKNAAAWSAALAEATLNIDVTDCGAVLDILDELREAGASAARMDRRIEGIARDTRNHTAAVGRLADALGVAAGRVPERLRSMRDRLAAARTSAALHGSLDEEDKRRHRELKEAEAKLTAANDALVPFLVETGAADRVALGAAIERSKARRALVDGVTATESAIIEAGDGLGLDTLIAAVEETNPDRVASQLTSLEFRLDELNAAVDAAATEHGDARATFAALDTGGTAAVDAAADAEQARSELEVLAEDYILKRTQAVTLKWAIEKYRERHQDPLLLRAGELFSTLTTGRYATLKIDTDGPSPKLRSMRDDMRTMVDVDAMSEGTTDQLFLALRLAALEQSVAAGVALPFLADDLFVNFDDRRAQAGFQVLAEIARTTQVLFFTHHPHLVEIAKSVVGAELHSECRLS